MVAHFPLKAPQLGAALCTSILERGAKGVGEAPEPKVDRLAFDNWAKHGGLNPEGK